MGFESINQGPALESEDARLERLRRYAGAPEGADREAILATLDADGFANISKEDEKFLQGDSQENEPETLGSESEVSTASGKEERLQRLREYAGVPEGATKEQVLEALDDDGLAYLPKDDEDFLRAA